MLREILLKNRRLDSLIGLSIIVIAVVVITLTIKEKSSEWGWGIVTGALISRALTEARVVNECNRELSKLEVERPEDEL